MLTRKKGRRYQVAKRNKVENMDTRAALTMDLWMYTIG
jgi:hypothetical protein